MNVFNILSNFRNVYVPQEKCKSTNVIPAREVKASSTSQDDMQLLSFSNSLITPGVDRLKLTSSCDLKVGDHV